jgi:hypothetical protein
MAKFLRIPIGNATNSEWSSVATGANNVVVAVASRGPLRVARSTDGGVNWTYIAPGTNMDNKAWVSVASNGANLFVAVANAGGTNHIMYSSNAGETWQLATTTISFALNSVAWNGTRFVAVGDNSGGGTFAQKSTTGITWDAIGAYPENRNYSGVIWSGTTWIICSSLNEATPGKSIAVGNTDNVVSWANAANSPASRPFASMAKMGSLVVAVTAGNQAVSISQDGTTTYTTITVPAVFATNLFVTSDGTTVAFVGRNSANGPEIQTTTNGTAFTARVVPFNDVLFSAGASSGTNSLILVSSQGGNSKRSLRTSDLSAWTAGFMGYPPTPLASTFVYANIENSILLASGGNADRTTITTNNAPVNSDVINLQYSVDPSGVTHEILSDYILECISGTDVVFNPPVLPDGRFIFYPGDFGVTTIVS